MPDETRADPPRADELPAAPPPEYPSDTPDASDTASGAPELVPILRRPAHRVDPRARWVWLLTTLIAWLFVLVPLAYAAWWVDGTPDGLRTATIVLAAAVTAYLLVMPEWRYRVHRWEVTDAAVYTLTGWITQTSRIAPISRVQTVDSHFGPVQRLFGLGTLKVTTASAHGAVEVAGLRRAQVEELVGRLTAITARDAGDAT